VVYAYANIILSDADALNAYRAKAAEALAKHSGQVVQAAPQQTVLEGERDETGIGAILAFESAAGAKAWIRDPELAGVHALRRGAGRSTITLLG
jgi:uncharacterized protein (DUF1330 family)